MLPSPKPSPPPRHPRPGEQRHHPPTLVGKQAAEMANRFLLLLCYHPHLPGTQTQRRSFQRQRPRDQRQ